MTSKLTVSVLDYGEETSTLAVRGADVTSVNFDAQEGLLDDIVSAIDGVSIGTLYKNERVYAINESPKTPPASQYAQRESKWLVRYTDDVDPNGNGSFEIPCADLTLLVANTDTMNTAAGAGATLVAALEAGMVSRLGNAITVTSIVHVGRNI